MSRLIGCLEVIEKGWRIDLRTDAILPSNVARIIHIDLCKCQFAGLGVRCGQLFEDWGYCFARTAPVGVEVGYDVRI